MRGVEFWDDVARRWLGGTLEPSNGRDVWSAIAHADAAEVERILRPFAVRDIVEVGSGVGRLTPYLAEHFAHVIAIDTSPGMVEATELACDHLTNVSVRDQRVGDPYPVGDTALLFDVIDSDWTHAEADELVEACLRSCLLVLVHNTRLVGWQPMGDVVRSGASWSVIQADVV